jgi:D-tyrosyl-tRNA(Tyr) deacylase
MKVVVQRVNYSKLTIDNKIYSEINNGLLVLVGVTHNDDLDDISWLSKKIINLRIFNDENNIMNKSLLDISGEFIFAEKIYNSFILEFEIKYGFKPKTGKFGHDMKIEFENDGPVTIIIDSKNK